MERNYIRKADAGKNRKKIKVKYIVFILLITIFLYLISTAISIWNYGGIEEAEPADTAIILGAGTYNDEVSPVFRERIRHGIWLYQNGYVKTIILTGGYGKGNVHSDSYVGKLYAQSQGVPGDDILIEETSTITQENLENAKLLMDENSYSTAILVSDPLHMKRAMLMAKDYGIKAYSSPTPTTRYISNKSKLAFLAREVFFYVGYKVVY